MKGNILSATSNGGQHVGNEEFGKNKKNKAKWALEGKDGGEATN